MATTKHVPLNDIQALRASEEKSAWECMRLGDWAGFAQHAETWKTYRYLLESAGHHVRDPFRAIIDVAIAKRCEGK